MIWIIIAVFLLFIYLVIDNSKNDEDPKIKELEIKCMGLEKHILKMQDTLDHYGIRMSNKMPDENKYYKRWYK